jgi:hypothetical protein
LADQVRFISLSKDAHGGNASYATTFDEWEQTLATAWMHGWEPMGTVLDFEFHRQLEISRCKGRKNEGHWEIARKVLDKCRDWHGEYLLPEGQVVTEADAKGLKKALEGTDAAPDLLRFLSLGAFRITV